MFTAYPKQLTDPAWKKVEKATGVSATGVGQTLRDAEQRYKTLMAGMVGLEAGKVQPAAVKPAKDATAVALRKSEKALEASLRAIKNEDKKKFLTKYGQFIGHIASELENMDLADRRGLKIPIDRYNDRVQMWVKWVGL